MELSVFVFLMFAYLTVWVRHLRQHQFSSCLLVEQQINKNSNKFTTPQMANLLSALVALSLYLAAANCQSTLPPGFNTPCLPYTIPYTFGTLPNCVALDTKLAQCDRNATCVCSQEVFNLLVGYAASPVSCSVRMPNNLLPSCKSDWRLCTLSYNLDAKEDDFIAEWTRNCAAVTKPVTTLTTPTAVPLLYTYDVFACQTIYQSCVRAYATDTSCVASFAPTSTAPGFLLTTDPPAAASALSSCRCGPEALAQASTCEILGAVDCLRSSIGTDTAWLWGVQYCGVTPSIPPILAGNGLPATEGNPPPQRTTRPTTTTNVRESTPTTTSRDGGGAGLRGSKLGVAVAVVAACAMQAV